MKYSMRENNIPKLCELIYRFNEESPGNNIVFLPSFEYLKKVAESYEKIYSNNEDILVQKENHSKATACRGFLLLLSFLQFYYTSYISALVLFSLLQTVCSTLFCTPGIYSNYELCNTAFLSLFLPRQFLPGISQVLLFYCFHNIVVL